MPDKHLVVIDGFSLLFRAFFGTRYLSTSDGKPTNALFGLTSMLFTLLDSVKPDAIVVAMDAPGKTFRHDEYSEYKGTRKETDPALIEQIPHAYALIKALGIPIFELTGYEADDIVGTITLLGEQNGYQTTIVTGDLDQLQLVDHCVSVMTTRQGVTDVVIYTPDRVMERYGVPPERVPDWKAIVGDTSDNIPGVPGIGEKGATALLQAHGSIDGICEALAKEEVEPKYAKKLTEEVVVQMRKSLWLATIKRDAPVDYDFEPFRVSDEQFETARLMLESFEFRSHVKKLPVALAPFMENAGTRTAPVEVREENIEVEVLEMASEAAVREWVGENPFALTFEAVVSQASMFDEPEKTAYLAREHQVIKTSEAIGLSLFESQLRNAIVHDSKPLYKRIAETLAPVGFDTMLAGYVLQSNRSTYALRDLVQGYLDINPPTNMAQMSAALFRLEAQMRDRLVKEDQLTVLTEMEQPLVPVLAQMERAGITVSADVLGEMSKQLEVSLGQTAQLIYEMAGQEFNIGSPKQLGDILFEKLQIPGPKKTKTGYATGAEVLQVLAPSHPICSEILSWRELSKLKSTYADSLPRLVAEDGRIHTTYHQTVAATGRLSSNDPNLQNIPIRTDLGRQIRKAFLPAPGMQLLSLDYSQIELRVLAHMCGEPALVDAFERGEDIHGATAALMWNEPLESVSKEHRRFAKLLNFAVLYGVTDFGLANQLGGSFSVSEAKALIQQYNERFPKINEFMAGIVGEAKSKGFTTTLCKRRRYFPDIHAQNRNERMYAERQAMNAPIQGTAADMIKLAMIHVRKDHGLDAARMLLQVHDELLFEIAPNQSALVENIRSTMENALPLDVPILVDAKSGDNWLEMTEIPRPL